MKDGILCINKPAGFTSFDVIGKLRGILKFKRLGHSGTLDPMATGVLPVFVGKATKCCDILPNDDKCYIAGFKFGATTNTQDSTGTITHTFEPKKVTIEDIQSVLKDYIGEILQVPPMYSAVSINGQRLYDLARKNIVVERPPRKIVVYSIRVLSYGADTLSGTLEISCGKGTYVRTLINDIGDALGVGGYMTSLVRTSASGFDLKDCYSFEDVTNAMLDSSIDSLIVPTETIFKDYPKLSLSEVQTKQYRNGVKLPILELNVSTEYSTYAVYSFDGVFIGTANVDPTEGVLRVGKNF